MTTRTRNQRKAPTTEAASVLQESQTENQKLEQTIEKMASAEIDTDEAPKRKWTIRKTISGRERRQRQNQRLRKLLVPKNALQSFNELNTQAPVDFKVESNGQQYVAELVYNNVKYEGYGKSKMAAKNDASEKVMRDLVISKLSAVKQQSENANGDDVEMEEDAAAKKDDDDEVPMIQLASFALHKLFAEWSAEGFEIPDLVHGHQKTNDTAVAGAAGEEVTAKAKKPAARRTELPPNAATMHPTMTLAMMRPQTAYQELGSTGTPPTMVYNVGVTVDGEEFVASARSKKLARKSAAIKACNKLFGTNYTEDFQEIP